MQDSPGLDREGIKREHRKVRLANLEADVAYFQARLEILGEPETVNQRAQHRVFTHLQGSLGEMILKTRRRMLGDR